MAIQQILNRFLILVVFLISATGFAEIRVGLVLDKGGKDDKSFNSAAYEGAQRATKEISGVSIKVVEATDNSAIVPLLRQFARRKYDLTVAVGVSQASSVEKVAKMFPDQKFAIVDGKVDLPNVRSLLFEEHEGSFLVGAIAALRSKTGKIGFIGGMDIPLIRRFEKGYIAGAKAMNPKIEVLSNYVGITGQAWNDPGKAKELATSQYQRKADIVFGAAGASNMGLFDAAEELKRYAIGVDSNQNWIKPGFILTSMLKRVDVAVYQTLNDLKNGHFTAGVKRYGLKNDGIAYSIDQYNKDLLSQQVVKQVDQLKSKIVEGKIKVPDYYDTM